MAYELKDRQVDSDQILYKAPTIPEKVAEYVEPVDLDVLLDGLTLRKLNRIFHEVMKRQTDKIDPVRSKFGKIEKEEVYERTSEVQFPAAAAGTAQQDAYRRDLPCCFGDDEAGRDPCGAGGKLR